jgi:hypothetical protein
MTRTVDRDGHAQERPVDNSGGRDVRSCSRGRNLAIIKSPASLPIIKA